MKRLPHKPSELIWNPAVTQAVAFRQLFHLKSNTETESDGQGLAESGTGTSPSLAMQSLNTIAGRPP
jgi:hypothetical protein